MNVLQAYPLYNQTFSQVLGKEAVLQQDYSNFVSMGETIINTNNVDNYGGTLMNVIGKTYFEDTVMRPRGRILMVDKFEYGAYVRKLRVKPKLATENPEWALVPGTAYPENIFNPAEVVEKFYSNKTTYDLDVSLPSSQVKESLQSPEQGVRFITMIMNMIDGQLREGKSNFAMACICNLIAESIYKECPDGVYGGRSGNIAINVYHLFKQKFPDTTITSATFLEHKDSLNFWSALWASYIRKIQDPSVLFNIEGWQSSTPLERLRGFILADVLEKMRTVSLSQAFTPEMLKLYDTNIEELNFWQGQGTDYSFASASKIHVKTSAAHEVEIGNVIGCLFDQRAAMVYNEDDKATSVFNTRGKFTQAFRSVDGSYLNDTAENCVVFYLADDPS